MLCLWLVVFVVVWMFVFVLGGVFSLCLIVTLIMSFVGCGSD